jgi:hypothetical protein
VSFRLGPGTADAARAIAAELAGAGPDATEHVLFLDADAGEYGCLAVWGTQGLARGYGDRAAVRRVLAALAARTGKEPRVRCYRMENVPPGP